MLSTALSRTDPFWTAWSSDDPSWIRLKATADTLDYDPEFLATERAALGESAYQREYLGIPAGEHVSPFGWDLYERMTHTFNPLLPPGSAFMPAEIPPTPLPNPFRSLHVYGGVR